MARLLGDDLQPLRVDGHLVPQQLLGAQDLQLAVVGLENVRRHGRGMHAVQGRIPPDAGWHCGHQVVAEEDCIKYCGGN